MSYQAVDWVFEDVKGISSTDALILVALVRKIPLGEDTHRAYQAEIAAWTKTNERTVRNACKRLVEAGILETRGRGGISQGGKGIPLEYRVIGIPTTEQDGAPDDKGGIKCRLPDESRNEMPTKGGSKCRQEAGTKCRQLPNNQNSNTKREEIANFHPAILAWNEMAEKIDLPKVTKQTKARTRSLQARLKDLGGEEGWQDFLRKIDASPFLTGKAATRKPFKATFDWATKESNFVKIMEGNYDGTTATPTTYSGNMAGNTGTGGRGQPSSFAALIARDRLQERS